MLAYFVSSEISCGLSNQYRERAIYKSQVVDFIESQNRAVSAIDSLQSLCSSISKSSHVLTKPQIRETTRTQGCNPSWRESSRT